MCDLECKASVIIPVYNQWNILKYTILEFINQYKSFPFYEVIVVDDGSNDEIAEINSSFFLDEPIKIKIIHQSNKGRANARNTGVNYSTGELIVFCDADRIPGDSFVEKHYKAFIKEPAIHIGLAYDYFGVFPSNDYSKYNKMPSLYKNIYYEVFEKNNRLIKYLGFLTGNLSIDRGLFLEHHGFDEEFCQWGMEHFELGYRLQNEHMTLLSDCHNYHIPHKRPNETYYVGFKDSIDLLCEKHKSINKNILLEFFKSIL